MLLNVYVYIAYISICVAPITASAGKRVAPSVHNFTYVNSYYLAELIVYLLYKIICCDGSQRI